MGRIIYGAWVLVKPLDKPIIRCIIPATHRHTARHIPFIDDRNRFAQNDVAFHSALAAATHNQLFSILLDSVVDIMLKVRQMGFEVPGSPSNALKFHRAIYEQVRAGDPGGAREAMRVHLIDSEEVMRQALALHAHRAE
jgi:DNA-binding FadR family transcriptional regulator